MAKSPGYFKVAGTCGSCAGSTAVAMPMDASVYPTRCGGTTWRGPVCGTGMAGDAELQGAVVDKLSLSEGIWAAESTKGWRLKEAQIAYRRRRN